MTQQLLQFKPMATHIENLQRTRSALERHILDFFLARRVGAQFHSVDLWQYVTEQQTCAPDSPRRIMSEMMTDGLLGYAVVNRRQSLYEITKLTEAELKEAA